MLVRPIQTEKAFTAQAKSTYMFIVPKSASKQEIEKTIAKEYGVTVISTRTVIRNGKKTRFSRGKHAYPGTTYRQDKKIAYVTLKDGDKIKVFDEEPVEEAKTAKTNDTEVSKKGPSVKESKDQDAKKSGIFNRRRTENRGDK